MDYSNEEIKKIKEGSMKKLKGIKENDFNEIKRAEKQKLIGILEDVEKRVFAIEDRIHNIKSPEKINDKLASIKMDFDIFPKIFSYLSEIDIATRNFELALLHSNMINSEDYICFSRFLHSLIEIEKGRTKRVNDNRVIMYEKIRMIKQQITRIKENLLERDETKSNPNFKKANDYLLMLDQDTDDFLSFFYV